MAPNRFASESEASDIDFTVSTCTRILIDYQQDMIDGTRWTAARVRQGEMG